MAESIEEKVKQIIVDELGVDESEVTPNARFIDDLGADSLDTVELVMRCTPKYRLPEPIRLAHNAAGQFAAPGATTSDVEQH